MESNLLKRKLLLDDSDAQLSKKASLEPSASSSGQIPTYKSYIKKTGTIDRGKEYEILMCALYALKFGTSDDVADFEMSTNVSESKDFDDIKLEVIYTNGSKRVYYIQLKHKQKQERIKEKDLCAAATKKNIFSLIKFLQTISTQKDNKEAVFILYTNCPTDIKNGNDLLYKTQDCLTVTDSSTIEYQDLLLNDKTPQQTSLFQFELKINNSNLEPEVLKQFYFAANQKNVDEVKLTLKKIFEDVLMCDISGSYIQFIQDWYLRCFVLTKHELITKVAELGLFNYIKVISTKKCNEKSEQLATAIMDHEMTITQTYEEEIVENIWKAADTHGYSILDFQKFGLTNDPPDLQKTKVLWYLDRVPLIVKVDKANQTRVMRVMRLIKANLKLKKIVLVGNVIKADFPHWTIFENLSDLVNNFNNKRYFRDILDNFKVSLQGREPISLKSLTELVDEMATVIGTKELLIMSQENFLEISNQKMKLPNSYISRTVSTIILDVAKTLARCTKIQKCIIIINCNEDFRKRVQLNQFIVMKLSQYLDENTNQEFDNLVLLSSKNKCTSIQFDQVCYKSPKFDVYVLQILDDKCCSLLLKKGNQLSLNLVEHKVEPIEESKIFSYFDNLLNVICAPPGMGKSTLLQNLYNTSPSQYWCIYVNLINHNAFLKVDLALDDIWKHFLQLQEKKQDFLVAKTVNVFLKRKKILLFLDGLDEVDSKYIDILFTFIKHASSEKANVWVSSRDNLREKILRTLDIVPVQILELDVKQQKKYVYDRLENTYSLAELKTIVEAIFNSADVVNSQEMLGIPLQLYIITENFLKSTKSTACLSEHNIFVLTTMYKQFFDGKKKFAYQKLGIEQQEHQLPLTDVLKKYEIPALQVCLNKSDFEKLDLDLNENIMFIESVKNQGDKIGIIKQIGGDDQVVFEHQTYAEYFASVWLTTHLEKTRLLRDQLFLEKYENLRIIFDIMLGEQNPLHLAVIYKNQQEIKKNIEHHHVIDKGGRKALHVACSYGMKYSQHFDFDSIFFPNNPPKRESECYLNTVEMLLSRCDSLDRDSLFGFTATDYSLRARCLYPVEKLLEKTLVTSEDLYQEFDKYYDAETLLFYACVYGYPEIFSTIVTHNSGILNSDTFVAFSLIDVVTVVSNTREAGNTTRVENYHNKYIKVIELLLDYGISVNFRNIYRSTALQFACEQSNVLMLKKLLQRGADVNAFDNEGMNALDYALESETPSAVVIELLMTHGIRDYRRGKFGKVALHVACQKGYVEIVKKLLEKAADINAIDSENRNALHYASLSKIGNAALIEMLVNKGMDVNATDKDGITALLYACQFGSVANVRTLISSGANILVSDCNRNNVLHYTSFSSEDSTEKINLLLNYEINVYAQNINGTTPLHFACQENNSDVVKILTEKNVDLTITNKQQELLS